VAQRKGKRQVSENSVGKPRASAVSVPSRGSTGQRAPAEQRLHSKQARTCVCKARGGCANRNCDFKMEIPAIFFLLESSSGHLPTLNRVASSYPIPHGSRYLCQRAPRSRNTNPAQEAFGGLT
jgi:hypothetical protein